MIIYDVFLFEKLFYYDMSEILYRAYFTHSLSKVISTVLLLLWALHASLSTPMGVFKASRSVSVEWVYFPFHFRGRGYSRLCSRGSRSASLGQHDYTSKRPGNRWRCGKWGTISFA
jgi:ribosomal protein S27AE